jgi:hypothetical protein
MGGLMKSIRPKRGEVRKFFETVVLTYDGQECLIWPYSTNNHGYGQINNGGKPTRVSRLICERLYGSGFSGAQAAHSCGKKLCVTPTHIRWKTRVENEADKKLHGTDNRGERHGNAKLTADEVAIIKSLRNIESGNSLARRFGVSRRAISLIHSGRTWRY